MIRFIKVPHLPEYEVNKLICGKISDELRKFIESYEVEIIESLPNANVDCRIKDHVDISIHHIGFDKIIIDKSQEGISEYLGALGLKVYFTNEDMNSIYPKDCLLNVARIGKYAVGRLDSFDSNLSALLKLSNVDCVNVNQGYSKCSICVINESAIITDDKNIAKTVSNIGLDCLLVSKGDIKLSGYDYGFIGGASGMIAKNHLLFFGDITQHHDYQNIRTFLADHGCRFDYLQGYPLTDIGGIIPITEKFR